MPDIRSHHECRDCGREWEGDRDDSIDLHCGCTSECYCDTENCSECGELVCNRCAVYNYDYERFYCADCAPQQKSYADVDKYEIYPHDTKLSDYPVQKCIHENTVALGIELELASKDSTATMEALSKSGLEYLLKHDGSIKTDSVYNSDIELVTMPTTIQALRKVNLRTLLAELNKTCQSYDYDCGLHVHLSKDLFSTTSYSYSSWRLARNERKLKKLFATMSKFLWSFSKRERDNYCKIYESEKQYSEGDRYQAINFTNDETIEIRVFRGTTNYERVHASLLFCDSLPHYIRTHSYMSISPKTWWRYVQSEPRYTHLVKYINKHNLNNILKA